jgi:hypothetical protein
MKALKVANWESAPNLEIEIRERQPGSPPYGAELGLVGVAGTKWENPEGAGAKARLRELVRSRGAAPHTQRGV